MQKKRAIRKIQAIVGTDITGESILATRRLIHGTVTRDENRALREKVREYEKRNIEQHREFEKRLKALEKPKAEVVDNE